MSERRRSRIPLRFDLCVAVAPQRGQKGFATPYHGSKATTVETGTSASPPSAFWRRTRTCAGLPLISVMQASCREGRSMENLAARHRWLPASLLQQRFDVQPVIAIAWRREVTACRESQAPASLDSRLLGWGADRHRPLAGTRCRVDAAPP
jgi:hypothetical protein